MIPVQQLDQPIFLEAPGSGTTSGTVAEKITRHCDVRSEVGRTLRELQLIDLAGLNSPLSAVEPEMRTNRMASQRDADETSIRGGHRGVHILYFQSNSRWPVDADVHDEVSTLRKYSFQGETRRTI